MPYGLRTASPYTLSFPQGYDDQAEFKAPFRDYLPGVIVELEDGARHRLSFIDLVRLEQGLADNAGAGIRTTPKRGLSWFQNSPPKRFNWPCRVYGTRGTSI